MKQGSKENGEGEMEERGNEGVKGDRGVKQKGGGDDADHQLDIQLTGALIARKHWCLQLYPFFV